MTVQYIVKCVTFILITNLNCWPLDYL